MLQLSCSLPVPCRSRTLCKWNVTLATRCMCKRRLMPRPCGKALSCGEARGDVNATGTCSQYVGHGASIPSRVLFPVLFWCDCCIAGSTQAAQLQLTTACSPGLHGNVKRRICMRRLSNRSLCAQARIIVVCGHQRTNSPFISLQSRHSHLQCNTRRLSLRCANASTPLARLHPLTNPFALTHSAQVKVIMWSIRPTL